jgi:hypothetical protein
MSAKNGFSHFAKGMYRSLSVVRATDHAVIVSGTYEEGGPPVDVADRLSASLPYAFFIPGISKRLTKLVADDDKSVLAEAI